MRIYTDILDIHWTSWIMARKVKDKELDSREARSKLKPRGKPYWRSIERGLHLGYRRLRGKSGSWCTRVYRGDEKYKVEALAIADDNNDADGIAILSFWQATDKARQRLTAQAKLTAGDDGPYTVNRAVDDYLAALEANGRSPAAIADARGKSQVIRSKLGDKTVGELTTKDLRGWRNELVKAPARTKTGKTRRQLDEDDAERARQASASRVWTLLRAALNRAHNEGHVDSNSAWRRVKSFRSVDRARVRYLSVAEATRLANATDGQFRPMVQAALLTGARYGQLCRLRVRDFNRDSGTVDMSTRKGDGSVRSYAVHLTREGIDFFTRICAGRGGNTLMFSRPDGSAWLKSNQNDFIAKASQRAGIKPAINYHALRHTYASHTVMNGIPLLVLAHNLGQTSTKIVEQHYGHLSPSYKASVIRDKAPVFGFKKDQKVTALH